MELAKYEAKLRFAKALVGLTSETPYEKITVGQIVERTGKSRKTFYYHFSGRGDLVEWLFRFDIACELERHFPREELIFHVPGDDRRFDGMPYYARHVLQDGTINNAAFFEVLSKSLEAHRDYYRSVFTYVGKDSLDSYLHLIYTPCVKEDVRYLIDRELSFIDGIDATAARNKLKRTSSVDFLAEFFTGAFISRVIMRIHDSFKNRSRYDIEPFDNVIHESLQLMIANHVGDLIRS